MNTQTAAETQDRVGRASYTPNTLSHPIADRMRAVATFLSGEDMPKAAKELTDLADLIALKDWCDSNLRNGIAAVHALNANQPSESPDLQAVEEALGEANGRIAELEARLQGRKMNTHAALWVTFCLNYKGTISSKHAVAFNAVMNDLGIAKGSA